jgi:hypothetical protein
VGDATLDEELQAIEGRIARHPGYLNYAQASALLATIKHVVEPNWRELLAALDAPNANPMLALELVQNVRKPVVRDKFRATLDQKLHNYLAGAFTLVDHVRRIVESRNDEPVEKMLAAKPALLANPEVSFMQDLRNFTLHRTLPVTSSRVNVTAPNQAEMTMESFIELSIPSLLEWKKWTSTSKAFLAAQGDAVNLRPVVAKHGELILTFNTVFFNDLEAANATHLDGLNELVTERNALLAGIPIEDARRVTESWTRRRNGEDVPIPGFGAPLFGSAPSDPQ